MTHPKGLPGLPKVFHVGSNFVPNIWRGVVEITEKVDGSMFGFGLDESGELVFRSKGKQLFPPDVDNLFAPAVWHILGREGALRGYDHGTFLYGEAMCRPKHNTLTYERTPNGHVALFGGRHPDGEWFGHDELSIAADRLGVEVVPRLYLGEIAVADAVLDLQNMLETDSFLGGQKVEGVVVKNYSQPIQFQNQIWPSFAKLVRPEFSEKNSKEWKGKNHAGALQPFMDSFRSTARWEKAVQHLRDNGELSGDPRDIGPLIKEVHADLVEEEIHAIKDGLYDLFIKDILRKSTAGLPEWWKDKLLTG